MVGSQHFVEGLAIETPKSHELPPLGELPTTAAEWPAARGAHHPGPRESTCQSLGVLGKPGGV